MGYLFTDFSRPNGLLPPPIQMLILINKLVIIMLNTLTFRY